MARTRTYSRRGKSLLAGSRATARTSTGRAPQNGSVFQISIAGGAPVPPCDWDRGRRRGDCCACRNRLLGRLLWRHHPVRAGGWRRGLGARIEPGWSHRRRRHGDGRFLDELVRKRGHGPRERVDCTNDDCSQPAGSRDHCDRRDQSLLADLRHELRQRGEGSHRRWCGDGAGSEPKHAARHRRRRHERVLVRSGTINKAPK
jgi:hypothetical protein